MYRLCILVLLTVQIAWVKHDLEADVIPAPKQLRRYLKMDQQYNVRSEEPALSGEVIPVYHWEIPMERAAMYISPNLTQAEQDLVLVGKGNGQKVIRIFAVNDPVNSKQFEKLSKELGEPKQELSGSRIQGSNSYLVWGIKDDIYTIKFSRGNGRGAFDRNTIPKAELAIRNCTLLEKIYDAHGLEHDFFHEHIAMAVSFKEAISDDFEYVNIVRNMEALLDPDPDIEILSLHSILAMTDRSKTTRAFVRKAAKLMGISEEEWLEKEVAIKLAVFSAQKNFKDGFYIEGHSQNLLARYNKRKGTIIGFRIRDLGDIMFDPSIMLLNGEELLVHNHFNELTIVNAPSLTWSGTRPWEKVGLLFGQCLVSPNKDELDPRLMSAFARTYVHEAESITGVEHIKVRKANARGLGDIVLRYGLSDVIKDAYTEVQKRRFRQLTGAVAEQAKDPAKAAFIHNFKSQRIVVLDPLFEEKFNQYKKKNIWDSSFLEFEACERGVVTYYFGIAFAFAYNPVPGSEETITLSLNDFPVVCSVKDLRSAFEDATVSGHIPR